MSANHALAEEEILAATEAWLTKAVIGLNLCPFAKAVYIKNQIRYVVSRAQTPQALAQELHDELLLLQSSNPDQTDTTLLIHPQVLTDFLEYNDFLNVADAMLEKLDLAGELQVASFHPAYQFADSAPDDITNYTNRSPYPMLHLLREASIERAVAAIPDAADIYEKNMTTLKALGLAGWRALLSKPSK
ncbi:MAG: DUF1415 domain-containing protein [Burkholderiales bacterium]|nr:DUF1415 domain-containing protein [Burkholderiales bacterium]